MGRKSRKDEELINTVIHKSFECLKMFFEKKSISLEEKAQVAVKLAGKAVPKDLNVNFLDPFKIEITMQQPVKALKEVNDRQIIEIPVDRKTG